MAIAFAAPLLLGLFPRVQLPSVVLEIVAGIDAGARFDFPNPEHR